MRSDFENYFKHGDHEKGFKGSPALSIAFFPAALFYHEVLLRLFDGRYTDFFGAGLFRTLLFSVAAGLFVFLVLDLIPKKSVSRFLGGALIFLFTVILCVERGVRNLFGFYYGPLMMVGMTGDVVENFAGATLSTIWSIMPFILLSLVPFVLFVLLRQIVIYKDGQSAITRGVFAVLLILLQLGGFLVSYLGADNASYTYDYTANTSIPAFGLLTSLRLEVEYAVFGTPEADLSGFIEDDPGKNEPDNSGNSSGTEEPGPGDVSTPGPGNTSEPGPGTQEPTVPVEYGYNILDIDFEALAAAASGDTIKSMHEYFGSLSPTQQNEYTGMFEGKNLILITAESFCTYAIDPVLTPTLYKLTHEGFVFTNFYQPDWTLSTTGGEFAVTTGVIPNWVGKSDSSRQVIGNAMPTTLGNMFSAKGYVTPAWHNGTYTFYSRNQYLDTFGYDYKGEAGGGLDLTIDSWPRSDREMIEATCDSYIDAYLKDGTLFHAYYMTISGHGPWSFSSNHRAAEYKELVQERFPGLSEPCQAYIASNIDLDRGLEVLLRKLEVAGIAGETLIVMAADHYPYFLCSGNSIPGDSTDYYNELNAYFGEPNDSEMVTSRYRNTLLMWSGSIEEPIVVDTPCYSCDIVPTLANLFGLEYDSRLYTGRDIFATNYEVNEYSSNMPLVIFANNHGQGNSWITAAGTYEASTKTFTPNPGVTVSDDYVSRVNRLVSGKLTYSKLIVTQDYYKYVFR